LTSTDRDPQNNHNDRAHRRPAAELSYEEATDELNTIVRELEEGFVNIDKLVDYLERATEIINELEGRIKRTKAKVEELVPRLESVGRDLDSNQETTGPDHEADNEPSYEPIGNSYNDSYLAEDDNLTIWDEEPF